jgi:hypothetical protein
MNDGGAVAERESRVFSRLGTRELGVRAARASRHAGREQWPDGGAHRRLLHQYRSGGIFEQSGAPSVRAPDTDTISRAAAALGGWPAPRPTRADKPAPAC